MTRDEAINKLMCGVVKAIRLLTDTPITLSGDPKKPFLYRGRSFVAADFKNTSNWEIHE